MNQPISTAMPVRTGVTSDAPDILQVMRRYVWLLAVGTAIGAGVAGSMYYYYRKTRPLYRSTVAFQVLPPPSPLGLTENAMPVLNPDDTSQFIHRQVHYIMQDKILKNILQSKEFQSDYTAPEDRQRTSQWLRENANLPERSLKNSLSVTPLVDSAAFEISMTARDPFEAFNLVNAAQKVYVQNLKADNKQTTSERLDSLNKVRRDQEQTVNNLTIALNTFRATLNIPALTSRHAIELAALQNINNAMLEYETKAQLAQSSLKLIMDQEKDPSKIVITPDMEQFIQEDFEMRTLQNTKLNLEQEVAAAKVNQTSSRPVEMLKARMDTVDKQMLELRKELEQRAFTRMKDRVNNDYNAVMAQLEKIRSMQKTKEEYVKELDSSLIQYQQKADELKAQQEILEKLRRQDTLAVLSAGTDDARIQLMVSASKPDASDFVWPNPLVFLPIGTAAGFGLSLLIAYALVFSDTRVRTPRDITKTLQLPLLGFVPDESDDRALTGDVASAIVSFPNSMVAESFRQIRSHLLAQTENSPVNTLLVSSISPGGGSTTVACNLASSMALNDRRVLLVDANFYRPGLGSIFKNLPVEGFSDLLEEPSLLSTAIVPSQQLPKLHVLGAGRRLAKGSSEAFESKAFRDLLEQLKTRYDLIIFDGAPLNLVADSVTLASRLDGVVSVIRAGEVSRGTVTRIREQLRQVHANLLGFVLNAAQTSNTGYFKENYRSFYRYAGQGARAKTQASR